MTREQLLGAIARGWCNYANSHKALDSALVLGIAEEIEKYLAAPEQPAQETHCPHGVLVEKFCWNCEAEVAAQFEDDSRCPTCGEDGGTSCGAVNCGLLQKAPESVNQMLLEALNAMLTHMGMDEDEWNKPTFDQARAAIAAAEQAPQPELSDEEIDEITAHCHDGRAYPMDAMMLPILLRRVEARAVLAAQRSK